MSRLLAILGLICFTLTTAILPAGHMAAPLQTGAAFNLCPSDHSSAQWIELLAAQSATPDLHAQHTQHMAGHGPDHGAHHSAQNQHSGHGAPADHTGHETVGAECELAASALAGLLFKAYSPIAPPAARRPLIIAAYEPQLQQRHWLRPPTRSPTA